MDYVAEWTIVTIAGVSPADYRGPATESRLDLPKGVVVDGWDNLYVADSGNHRICKVDAAGDISTVAGTGEWGCSGDGGPAIKSRLFSPSGVALDGMGNLYIIESEGHRIRKVDAAGNISTVAGTGETDPETEEGGYSGDGGPAVQAQLSFPSGVAADGMGNLYIADAGNHRIRKVDAAGNISTVVGTGEADYSGDGGPAVQAQLDDPSGVAVDGTGNIYIIEHYNHRIRKVDAAGNISTVAGTGEWGYNGDDGPAVQAQLSFPEDVAADSLGNIYIADTHNHCIRKVDITGIISTVVGTKEIGDDGPATQAQLVHPNGIAVDDSGSLYIADARNHRIRKVDARGIISTVAGTGEWGYSGDGGPAVQAQLDDPSGVAVDDSGNLYIADARNHRIRKVDAAGNISTVAGTGEWGYSGDDGPAVQAQFSFPEDVAADGLGNIYIADWYNHRIRKVDAAGNISTVAGTGKQGYAGDGGPAIQAQLAHPSGVALHGARNIYIADSINNRIRKVDAAGNISTVAGTGKQGYAGDGGPAVQARLAYPSGVAVDGTGNLYIADRSKRILKVDAEGNISTVAETEAEGPHGRGVQTRLTDPKGVAVDGWGNIYVADSGNHRIFCIRLIRLIFH